MTDRRPDINCTGCGRYCYSLSHRPDEQVFPKQHLCGKCEASRDDGVRSSELLNHWFYNMGGDFEERYLKDNPDLEKHRGKIGSFLLTSSRSATLAMPRRDDREFLTADEWRELAIEKLPAYRQYCSNYEYRIIQEFVRSVRE